MAITIITDNKPRYMIYGCELPEKVRSDYDYIDKEEFDYHEFVKYKGNYYDVGDFERAGMMPEFKGWAGYSGDSFFSGVLLKIVDRESVVMGRYYS